MTGPLAVGGIAASEWGEPLLGPLAPLAADPAVSDVLVNGPADVWVDRDGVLQRWPLRFADEDAVRRLAQRLAAAAGRRLDDAAPFADARLPDGARLHAALAPLCVGGTAISLRFPPRRSFSLADVAAASELPPAGTALLAALAAAPLRLLVTGGTGTGKTTLLSVLLGEAPEGQRIVIAEDVMELRPAHPHVVRLEARPPNVEGAGAVTLRELVRQGLRMRPDRLVVGEVRGAEVLDLLAAFNTGHAGAGTLHAQHPADLPARVEGLAALAGIGRHGALSLLAAAVDAVVHVERTGSRRRVAGVSVVRPRTDGLVGVVPAAVFTGDGRMRWGAGAPALRGMIAGEGARLAPESAGCEPGGARLTGAAGGRRSAAAMQPAGALAVGR